MRIALHFFRFLAPFGGFFVFAGRASPENHPSFFEYHPSRVMRTHTCACYNGLKANVVKAFSKQHHKEDEQ